MSILANSFDNLTEENKKLIKEYFAGYDYNSSGYTYLANYAWRTGYEIYWEVINGYMFTGAVNPLYREPHTFFSMPLTADGKYEPISLRNAILEVKGRCEAAGIEFEIGVVPRHMKKYLDEAFPDTDEKGDSCEPKIKWENDPGDADYVYLKDKLISLSGRALHKKKNHMNFFKKNYNYTTIKINKNNIEKIMDFVIESRLAKEAENGTMIKSLCLEEEAIREYLRLVSCDGETRPGCRKEKADAGTDAGAEDEGKCIGCEEMYSVALSVDGQIVGVALGERLNENTAVEHFEKAREEYRGVYQVLCSEFCKILPEDIMYVNREEDMGLENLRQAKQSLKPDHMEEKLTCSFV